VEEFKAKGYNVDESILDRKMRNLKQSYKNIKDNNKKTSTGRGRISWEWYDTMEDIFKEDLTINICASLSSMINTSKVNNIREYSTSSIPSTSTEEHITNDEHSTNDENITNDEHITNDKLIINIVHSDIALSEIRENVSESSVRCVKECIKGKGLRTITGTRNRNRE